MRRKGGQPGGQRCKLGTGLRLIAGKFARGAVAGCGPDGDVFCIVIGLGRKAQGGLVGKASSRGRRLCLARPFLAGIGDRDQVPGKIAAVHRRDIVRRQHGQSGGVIPVEEMPAMAWQGLHRGQRRLQPVSGFQQSGPAKVPRRHAGQKIQPDIGG